MIDQTGSAYDRGTDGPVVASPLGPMIRPYRPDDRLAVEGLFLASMVLGQPAPLCAGRPAADAYVAFCLDWYLGEGAVDAVVAIRQDRLVGYALVCTDEGSHRRWVRRNGPRLVAELTSLALRGRMSPTERAFFRHRRRDAVALVRHGRHAGSPAHAHLNIDVAHRTASLARVLRDAIDARVSAAGHDSWSGEINAPVGRRSRALGRTGFEVVGREQNATLSWLTGTQVERLTVVRTVERDAESGDTRSTCRH